MANADDQAIRDRLRVAIATTRSDPTNVSRDIGRGKDYVRDFLEGRKLTMSAGDLAASERAMGLRPGTLLGAVSENFDQAFAAETIAGAMDFLIELSHAGFGPQLLKAEYSFPVAKSIAALLGEGAKGTGNNPAADSARNQARLLARAVWLSRYPLSPT